MSSFQQQFKQVTPEPVWRTASRARYAIQRAIQWPAATFHPWRRASIHRLAELKDIHRGQRCFIIGNGPSLKQTDMTRLKGQDYYWQLTNPGFMTNLLQF